MSFGDAGPAQVCRSIFSGQHATLNGPQVSARCKLIQGAQVAQPCLRTSRRPMSPLFLGASKSAKHSRADEGGAPSIDAARRRATFIAATRTIVCLRAALHPDSPTSARAWRSCEGTDFEILTPRHCQEASLPISRPTCRIGSLSCHARLAVHAISARPPRRAQWVQTWPGCCSVFDRQAHRIRCAAGVASPAMILRDRRAILDTSRD
jgi:hypothetical protein